MKKKNIIILSILSTILLGLTIFAGSKLKVKPKILETKAEDSIVNVSNTQWVFNDTLTPITTQIYTEQYTLNFKSNNENIYTRLVLVIDTENNYVMQLAYFENNVATQVYQNGTWLQNWAKLINIYDAENVDNEFIDWLNVNSTFKQKIPDDLYNTYWKLNKSLDFSAISTSTYNIIFSNANKNYQSIEINKTHQIVTYIDEDNNSIIVYNGGWNATNYRYPLITDGFNLDNQTLINWLIINGTWEAYIPQTVIVQPLALDDLMLKILTMPFSFINTAFNVTLWPNTPYAFNFRTFVLGIIAVLALLFIIRLFTSGFSVVGKYTGNVNRSTDKVSKKVNNIKPKDND